MFARLGSALDRSCHVAISTIDRAAGYTFIGAGYVIVPVIGAIEGAVDGAVTHTRAYHREVMRERRISGGWVLAD